MKILESMANGSIKIPNGIYKIISKNNAIIPVAKKFNNQIDSESQKSIYYFFISTQ